MIKSVGNYKGNFKVETPHPLCENSQITLTKWYNESQYAEMRIDGLEDLYDLAHIIYRLKNEIIRSLPPLIGKG